MSLYSSVRNRVFGLDLMRAVAILSVVLAHTQYFLSNVPGFTPIPLFDGVDLFFVLSGFLIGGILLRTIREQGATPGSILGFWRRRWLRTLPNYYLFLAINAVVCAIAFPRTLRAASAGYLVFAQNLFPLSASHRFFPEAWSLAVEEWFYLVIPVVLLLLSPVVSARRRAAALLLGVTTVVVVSTAARAWGFDLLDANSYGDYDNGIRKIVALRLDSPAIGVLGAMLKDRAPRLWARGRVPLALLGGALVVAAVAWMPDGRDAEVSRAFGTYHVTVLSIGFLCLLPILDGWKRATGRLARFATHTSLVSYSLYLVHYSLLVVPLEQAFGDPSAIEGIAAFVTVWVAGFALATLNYRHFESRVLRWRDARDRTEPEAVAERRAA